VLACGPAAQAAQARAVLGPEVPVTWLANERLSGLQGFVIDGPVERVYDDGRCVGVTYDDALGRWCLLGNLWLDDPTLDPDAIVHGTFVRVESVLAELGLSILDTVRTWLYVDRILDCYGELNAARRRYFRERGVFDHLVPASTGIGVPNAEGARLVMDVLAWQRPAGRVVPSPSPLQGSALDYGSAFSRGVELDLGDHRELLVSGTASIDPDGRTLHDDPADQVDLTMAVVEGILTASCYTWAQVSRAVVYAPEDADEAAARAWFKAHDLLELPGLWVRSDICRGDLRYEIEVDATA
jgi:enamine deaminase RidA (YjgF/YER057c/UK114 family)